MLIFHRTEQCILQKIETHTQQYPAHISFIHYSNVVYITICRCEFLLVIMRDAYLNCGFSNIDIYPLPRLLLLG